MTIQVWAEGFVCSDCRAKATLLGEVEGAANLEEAYRVLIRERRVDIVLANTRDMTYFGCRLFDNEADARRSFG